MTFPNSIIQLTHMEGLRINWSRLSKQGLCIVRNDKQFDQQIAL